MCVANPPSYTGWIFAPILSKLLRKSGGPMRMKGEFKARTPIDSLSKVASEVERTIRSVAPDLKRVLKYGAPTFQGRGDIITIGVWTKFVAVGFWNGAKLAARHPILEGTASSSRVAKLRTLQEAKSQGFSVLVRDAVKLDAAEPVHPRKK
jgi:hypothetical protein